MFEIFDKNECCYELAEEIEKELKAVKKDYATIAAAARRLVEAVKEYDAVMRQASPWPSTRMLHAVIDTFKDALAEVEALLSSETPPKVDEDGGG